MDKSKAIELLKQALADIPRLRGLSYDGQAFRLWRGKLETILKEGLEDDDRERLDSVQSKYFPDELEIDNLLLEENYLPKLNDYEVALKSIIWKYEILGTKGEGNKGGEVENRMNKKGIIAFLNEKMQELSKLGTLPPDNTEFPTWCKVIEIFLHKTLGKDSVEYKTFKEAGMIRGLVEDRYTEYRKAIGSRKTALASIIEAHAKLGDEEPLEPKDTIELPIQLFDAMQFHPQVVEASRELFEDGHYRDAIYRAFVEVNNSVKRKLRVNLTEES